jgi:VWFA-related protein
MERNFVDGKEQEILAFEKADQPLDLVLIVDTSPSTAYKPKDIKTFVTTLTESLKPQDKIQIISFNEELKILCESTNDKQIINKAVKKLEMGDGTSIYEAVETIFQKILGSDGGRKSIVILSDGVDTTSRKANYLTSLVSAEKSSAPVFVFYLDTFNYIPPNRPNYAALLGILSASRWVGSSKEDYELGLAYLQDIALLSGGRTLQVKNLAEVKTDEISGILEFLKPRYFISFKLAETVNPAERKQLKVRINRPNLTVRARGSFLAQ